MDDESVGFREVLRELCVDEEDCLALYHTGSRAYGTASKSSDWDFVMVVRDETKARYTGDTETDYLEQGLYNILSLPIIGFRDGSVCSSPCYQPNPGTTLCFKSQEGNLSLSAFLYFVFRLVGTLLF